MTTIFKISKFRVIELYFKVWSTFTCMQEFEVIQYYYQLMRVLITGTWIKTWTQNETSCWKKHSFYWITQCGRVWSICVPSYVLKNRMRNFLKFFLTVGIWNLNLKKWPLENRENNGPIDSKMVGYDWSRIFVFMISGLKIKIYRTVL